MNPSMHFKRPTAAIDEEQEQSPRQRRWSAAGIGAVLVIGAVTASLTAVIPRHYAHACTAMNNQVRQVERAYAQSEYSAVVAAGTTLLAARPALCAGTVRDQVLADVYTAAAFRVIVKPRPQIWLQTTPLSLHEDELDWQALDKFADQWGMTGQIPAKTVAIAAANEGSYELAVGEYRQAFADGQITVSDLQDVARYEQALVAWARILTEPSFPQARQQGEMAAATANAIATDYGLADQSACRLLVSLGYSDCTRVRPDTDDPFLQAVSQK